MASAAQPSSSGGQVTFLQFNICGSACNQGDVDRLVPRLRDVVLELDPDVVTLNEVCLAQADALTEQLRGHAQSAAFAATAAVSRCPGEPGSRWYGNAILSKRPGVGAPEIAALPNRPKAVEQRSVLSMRTPLPDAVTVVSVTHLVPRRNRKLNERQIAAVFALQSARAGAGEVVVLAGDLNATPQQVSAAADIGGFVDIDHLKAAPTLKGRKIDYVLLDGRYFTPLAATVRKMTELSDHRCLYGRTELRAAGEGAVVRS